MAGNSSLQSSAAIRYAGQHRATAFARVSFTKGWLHWLFGVFCCFPCVQGFGGGGGGGPAIGGGGGGGAAPAAEAKKDRKLSGCRGYVGYVPMVYGVKKHAEFHWLHGVFWHLFCIVPSLCI